MAINLVCEHCGTPFTVPPCRIKKLPVRFCSMRCRALYAKRDEVIAERFWKYVDQSAGAGGCWPWLAHRDRDGYGRFSYKSGKRGAHTVAYELTHGPLPTKVDGLPVVLMHTCDNPPCCNPAHLVLGNGVLNKLDSMKKGRVASGERNGRYKHGQRVTRKSAGLQAALVAA